MAKRSKKADAASVLFVETYITNGRNAKRAYLKLHPDVTDRTAEVEASKLLRKPDVAAYLKQREKELRSKYQLTTERVIEELGRIALSDVRRLYDGDILKRPEEWDDDIAAAVAGVKVKELFEHDEDGNLVKVGEIREVKIHDKNSALTNAMKHLGLFEKDREQLGKAIAKAIVVPAKAHGKAG